jgi:pimeloyl-ACP methyl ester carboxylesterase
MAIIDLPALISYIIKNTGLKKIAYVGHSMGTTNLMIGASMMPDFFTDNIHYAVLLSPVI